MITTLPQFRKAAEASFKRANPDAADVTLHWERCRSIKWAIGGKGFSGMAVAMADGYRTRTVMATYNDGMLMVR